MFFRKPFQYTFKNLTLYIVLTNVLVFFVSQYFTIPHMGLNVVDFCYRHCLWQPLTYMFMHGGFQHLFFNMIGLMCFGIGIERAVGSKEFALLYFFTGIFSGLFSVLVYYIVGKIDIAAGNVVPAFYTAGGVVYAPRIFFTTLVGASGAIYGLLFAFAVIYPRSKIFIWGIIPVPAPVLVGVYAIVEVGSQFFGSSNVAHLTHLAGFGFAWIYFMVRMGINPVKVWKNCL